MSNKPTRPATPALDPRGVDARLQHELPRWTLDGGQLCRRIETRGWKASLMVANTVGHLAEAAWHHPDLLVCYASVTVRLTTHDAGGITDKDFALAVKIEQVLMWRPGSEAGGVLEGAPDDPRFGYIVYD